MKRQHNFADRHTPHERSFSNEAQFLKFVRPRDQDNVTNLVRVVPNFSAPATLTLVELFQIAKLTEESGRAKGVSA
jgi:hypothetical protein